MDVVDGNGMVIFTNNEKVRKARAGVLGLAKSLANELASLNILVNTVSNFELTFLVSGAGSQTLVVALSQSGETADTLGAVKAARDRGAPVVGRRPAGTAAQAHVDDTDDLDVEVESVPCAP